MVKDVSIYNNLEKEKMIKKEISKLRKYLNDIPKNKLTAAEGLIHEAAFMRATLKELKDIIDENGPIDNFVQGDNEFPREHPAVKSYNTMIQRYTTVCKELFSLSSKEPPKLENDGFEDFVMNR